MLWILPSICHAQSNPNYAAQQSKEQQGPSTLSIAVDPQTNQSKPYKTDCRSPKDHDAADLCEQRRMAKAAEDAVWWSRLQTWLAGFGFIAVVATLIFTGIAAKAAALQVRLSRHALVETDRAFVFPKITQWKAIKDSKTNKITGWKIAVEWQNLGNTPTRYLRLGISKALRKDDFPDDFDFGAGIIVNDDPLVIGPGLSLESAELPLSLEEMEAILEKTQTLYVWGWAEYDDVFERTPRHRTEFCHVWSIGGDVRKLETFASRYSVYRRWNGADEECDGAIVTASPRDLGKR